MLPKKLFSILLGGLLAVQGLILTDPSSALAEGNSSQTISAAALSNPTPKRLWGENRFKTAKRIAETYSSGSTDHVILASGNDFADALASSVLAQKLNAPILLIDHDPQSSQDAVDYIQNHLTKGSTVTLIGGMGSMSSEFESVLKNMGYQTQRLWGQDRYETSLQLAQAAGLPKGTPVVIASGENFPDALSFSSIAAAKGWPILLAPQTALIDSVKNFLIDQQPTNIYIAGGPGTISTNLEFELKNFLPNSSIQRFAGADRFETSAKILQYFSPKASSAYFASGTNFADALAGSILAAKTGSPIILIDPSQPLPPQFITQYLQTLQHPSSYILGGSGSVSDGLIQNITRILNNQAPIAYDTSKSTKKRLSLSNSTIDSSIQLTGTVSPEVQWIMVRIQKEGQTLSAKTMFQPDNGNVNLKIYLQFGPGSYIVDIYTRNEASRSGSYNGYTEFKSTNLDTRDMSNLLPSDYVQSDDQKILDLAQSITSEFSSEFEKTKAIHDWVSSNIAYDAEAFFNNQVHEYSALETLNTKKAVCNGYANLTAALNRAVGIQTKIISGIGLGYGLPKSWDQVDKSNSNHAWNEVKIDGKWIIQDTTWDAGGIDNNKKFYFKLRHTYFDPSPEVFAKDHLKIAEGDY